MQISPELRSVLIPASKILEEKIYSCNAIEAIELRNSEEAPKLCREWSILVSDHVKIEIGVEYGSVSGYSYIPLTYMKQKIFPLYLGDVDNEDVEKMFMDMRYDMMHGAYHNGVEGLSRVIKYYAKEMPKALDANRKIKTLYR